MSDASTVSGQQVDDVTWALSKMAEWLFSGQVKRAEECLAAARLGIATKTAEDAPIAHALQVLYRAREHWHTDRVAWASIPRQVTPG